MRSPLKLCIFVSLLTVSGCQWQPVRLMNNNKLAGRLEIFYNGLWGTVCDDLFDDVDARVACFSLGFRSGRMLGNIQAGNGTIWLDDVGCTGTESHIAECPHLGWGLHNCIHLEDVSIECWLEIPSTPAVTTTKSTSTTTTTTTTTTITSSAATTIDITTAPTTWMSTTTAKTTETTTIPKQNSNAYQSAVIALSVIAGVSLLINVALLVLLCRRGKTAETGASQKQQTTDNIYINEQESTYQQLDPMKLEQPAIYDSLKTKHMK